MKVFLGSGNNYVGVDPKAPDVFYPMKPDKGSYQAVELTPIGDGVFVAEMIAAKRSLSFTPTGLELRPAGTRGGYELLRATVQPEGAALLYRIENMKLVGPVLLIEEA